MDWLRGSSLIRPPTRVVGIPYSTLVPRLQSVMVLGLAYDLHWIDIELALCSKFVCEIVLCVDTNSVSI